MNEVKTKSNILDNVVGLIIGIPIAVVVFTLSLPWILYHILVKAPLDNSKKRKFLKRNEGKMLLCVTTSMKYNSFKSDFINELKGIGINDVAVFNGEIPNNKYDNYDWDQLIKRERGFPILLQIHREGISQTSLKADFQAFFKKEIDSTQLLGSIKWKMSHKENE